MAIPLTILVCDFVFEPYENQFVYTVMSEILMFTANAWLFYLFANVKSSYRKTNLDEVGLPHNVNKIEAAEMARREYGEEESDEDE